MSGPTINYCKGTLSLLPSQHNGAVNSGLVPPPPPPRERNGNRLIVQAIVLPAPPLPPPRQQPQPLSTLCRRAEVRRLLLNRDAHS